jgi:hypothetical protein
MIIFLKQIYESGFNIWATILYNLCGFHSYKAYGKCPPGQIFSVPPKMKDSYQRDEICLKLSKCDIQVHYLCSISVNWSQIHRAESPPETLSAIEKMTSQTTEG